MDELWKLIALFGAIFLIINGLFCVIHDGYTTVKKKKYD